MGLFSLFTQLLPLPTSWLPSSGADLYRLCQFTFLSTPLLLPVLQFIQAPHGRFAFASRFNVHGNWSWFIMEVVSPITFAVCFLSQPLTSSTDAFSLSSIFSPSLLRLGRIPTANLILGGAFLLHYLQRAVISPWRAPPRSPMHVSVPASAIFFNLVNGFLMGSWIGGRSPAMVLPPAAFDAFGAAHSRHGIVEKVGAAMSTLSPRIIESPGLATYGFCDVILRNPVFLLGLSGWLIGFLSNVYHDEILLDVRRPRDQRWTKVMREDRDGEDRSIGQGQKDKPKYGVPKGGLYRFISYPNYLSEWFEWLSYSIAALSVTALSPLSPSSSTLPITPSARLVLILTSPPFLFLLAEFCPMFPRAIEGHRWYHSRFGVEGDGKGGKYPRDRKAIFPGLL
ncbi:unnamed protein product [Jaminaea pallidilutea]